MLKHEDNIFESFIYEQREQGEIDDEKIAEW